MAEHHVDQTEHRMSVHRTESGRRWVVECSCSYKSATRSTEAEALAAAIYHKRAPQRAAAAAARAARVNGGVTHLGTTPV